MGAIGINSRYLIRNFVDQILNYDVIVVGAGSAGAPLAARLSDNPDISVLLLEQGPYYKSLDQFPENIKNSYEDFIKSDTEHISSWPAQYTERDRELGRAYSGRLIGGGSSINGAVFLRGSPEDFDSWASLGNDEWGYSQVLPYFRKLEHDLDFGGEVHGQEGPIPVRRPTDGELLPATRAFLRACLSYGFEYNADVNHPDAIGVGPLALNDLNGLRVNTAIAYLFPRSHRSNLNILGGITARRVLFDRSKAIGVEVDSKGEIMDIFGKEIVLCGGAIASPTLMMRSGLGPKDQIQRLGISLVRDLPGVGQNLWNHPTVNIWLPGSESVLDEKLPNQMILRYTNESSCIVKDMAMTLESRPFRLDGVSYARLAVTLQLPRSFGRLYCTAADPDSPPFLEYRYYSDSYDLKRMRDGVRLGLSLAKDKAFEGIVRDSSLRYHRNIRSDSVLDTWLLRHTSTYHHSCGTCKMGPVSDPMAVVDQHCRVHGVQGLRIVDASIMPHIVRSNLNATCVMLGERVVDWITSELSSQ